MTTDWHKILAAKIVKELNLSWEQAGLIVGMVAENNQTISQESYKRGYNHGYDAGLSRGKIKNESVYPPD